MEFTCPTFLRRAVLYSSFISVIIVSSCAEIGSPPGGPEDKAAPYIVSSVPASGTVDVSADNTITIFFSERIVKPEGKRAVFISPRPVSEPQLDWKSDRLIIRLADSFEVDQTYIVSLSTDIVDLRRNHLDKTTTIAFSTGAVIDSGRVSGFVYGENKPAQGILVGLYDSSLYSNASPVDSIYADYLTQTGTGGAFTFDHLPSKEFLLIAFEDRNRNELFSPEREQFAVPDRVVRTGEGLYLDSLRLMLTSQSVAGAAIASASYTADNMIRVRLASAINLDRLVDTPSKIVLRPVLDTFTLIAGQAVLPGRERAGTEFTAYAGVLKEGVYILTVYYDDANARFHFDSLKVKPREDTQSPEMIFLPDNRPQLLEKLQMTAAFSEALDTTRLTKQTFQLFDLSDNQLPVEVKWRDPLHAVFSSADIEAGAGYRLKITEFEIVDNAGNTMGDSLREYAIAILDPDSLGTVEGRINVKLADRRLAPAVLRFTKVENGQTFDLPVSARVFKIELPAGKYLVSGFIDTDSNGIRDLGSVLPYRYSETVMTHPDTVAVRARFETAGVELEFK